jgi:hypothetical protein
MENPVILGLLMDKLGIVSLGFEWEPELYPPSMLYAKGKPLETEHLQESRDGRVTAGHFALLRKLHEAGKLNRFYCFDYWENGGTRRDLGMSSNLSAAHDKYDPILAAMGRAHASFRTELEADMDTSAAEYLKRRMGHVPRVMIDYGGGSYHNEKPKSFKHRLPSAANPTFRRSGNHYVFTLPFAHPAQVPCGR